MSAAITRQAQWYCCQTHLFKIFLKTRPCMLRFMGGASVVRAEYKARERVEIEKSSRRITELGFMPLD